MIGALYALGVKRKDLMKHYILLPTLISLIGGAIGTALAYTRIGVWYQMQDAYNYYSLPDIAVQVLPYTIIIWCCDSANHMSDRDEPGYP